MSSLPPRSRLLHIGLPKTGTTALQSTARSLRPELLARGVRYPGGGVNHRHAVSSLMGRRWGWVGADAQVPARRHWDTLMAEVDADTERRIWISHEFASESDDENAARFAAALGPQMHVVITLRPFHDLLASSWQQFVKSGSIHRFEPWLHKVLSDRPDLKTTPTFHRRNDQAGVVERWARAAGAERVHVVVVDRTTPTMLTDSFEDLLALPRGFLVDDSLGGLRSNRALSLGEAELLRRVNAEIKAAGIRWRDYELLIREGMVARMLQHHEPAPDQRRQQLPAWAAERANARGALFAERIAASGVTVLGDLAVLARPAAPAAPQKEPSEVDVELAADAVLGVLSAALDRGPELTDIDQSTSARAERATSEVSTRALLRVLGRRLVGRLRR